MRPYKELCRINSLRDLKLIKAVLNRHSIEYFVNGDPLDMLLLHIKEEMRVMVRHNQLPAAKRLIAGTI